MSRTSPDDESQVKNLKQDAVEAAVRVWPTLSIRVMTEDDMQTVIEWEKQEQWQPGYEDALPSRAIDPEGFYIGYVGDQRVVSASGVRYGDKYAFVGSYICLPEYRGRGYGLTIFNHAMNQLEGYVVGLEAIVAQESNYQKQGFVTAHGTIRMGGMVNFVEQDNTHENGVIVNGPSEDCMQPLLQFDRLHFPGPRDDFVRLWIKNKGHITRVARKEGKVVGYGVIRPCVGGMKIGPLFAASSSIASLLLEALTADCQVPVIIDIPEPNVDGVRLFESVGITKLSLMKRMYRGTPPKLPLESIFAISSAEMG